MRAEGFAFCMADWVWEIDPSGVITACSETVRNSMGYSKDEIIGRPFVHTVVPDHRAAVVKVFAEVLERKEPMQGHGVPPFHERR